MPERGIKRALRYAEQRAWRVWGVTLILPAPFLRASVRRPPLYRKVPKPRSHRPGTAQRFLEKQQQLYSANQAKQDVRYVWNMWCLSVQ
jgi:hypothetical protein